MGGDLSASVVHGTYSRYMLRVAVTMFSDNTGRILRRRERDLVVVGEVLHVDVTCSGKYT